MYIDVISFWVFICISFKNYAIKFGSILINLRTLIKVASTSRFIKQRWIKPHVAT